MRYLPFALAALLLSDPALSAPVLAAPDTPPAAPAAQAQAQAAPADGDTVAESAPEPAPPTWVYMVARIKLTDTDLTQVVFFKHPGITSMDACEEERNAGLLSGWKHFSRYYLKTLKGISYKVDYRCVEGTDYLTYWRKGEFMNRYYLVRTTDGKLDLQTYDNFFACRRALRKISAREDIDAFCGIASQSITAPPVFEEPAPLLEADPATTEPAAP